MMGAATFCTMKLKDGATVLRAKGYVFERGAKVRVTAQHAAVLIRAHGDEVELLEGEPVEPPSTAAKAQALRLLQGPDPMAALSEIKPIPAAVLSVLRKKDATEDEIKAAAKAGGPRACALFLALTGNRERAELCLTAE